MSGRDGEMGEGREWEWDGEMGRMGEWEVMENEMGWRNGQVWGKEGMGNGNRMEDWEGKENGR